MVKNLLLWLVIAAVLLSVFNNFNMKPAAEQVGYSEFIAEIQNDRVRKVDIAGLTITGERMDGTIFETIRPMVEDPKLIDDLLEHNVEVIGRKPEEQSVWTQLLVASFPILIIIAVFMFFMRQMQGGGGGRGGPMSFGKSKARLLGEDQITTTFGDVAGVDEAKEDVQELVEFLRDPSRFQKLGGRIPRGVLMVGQPGTGKTLLAKAIAGEAKVPFFSISGSDFVEMFVGVGASRVRDMFEQAKKQSPCIIFIDEIDAVGRHRGAGLGGGHDEREQTLNQLLVEMDGFEVNDGVIVIAATNRPDVLDPALLRPGRFDRQVVVGLPDIRRSRADSQGAHAQSAPGRGRRASQDCPWHTRFLWCRPGQPGQRGGVCLRPVRNVRSVWFPWKQFELAKDKIMMGAERKSMVMSEDEKRNTAYHEAGHAIVGRLMPEHDPVYKVSIIPRGRALGVTMFLPEEDRYSHSRRHIISQICSLFGGRIAEEMTLGRDGITTGASNDIKRATEIARKMVTQWGLSEKMGPLMYDEGGEEVFLGRTAAQQHQAMSDETATQIDKEVRSIVDECYATSQRLLEENVDKLHMMADALMLYETIDSDQIDDIMSGRTPREPSDWGGSSGNAASGGDASSADVEADSKGSSPIGGPAGEH